MIPMAGGEKCRLYLVTPPAITPAFADALAVALVQGREHAPDRQGDAMCAHSLAEGGGDMGAGPVQQIGQIAR